MTKVNSIDFLEILKIIIIILMGGLIVKALLKVY